MSSHSPCFRFVINFDFALTALNFHDTIMRCEEAHDRFIRFMTFKPGGVFGVIDHYALREL